MFTILSVTKNTLVQQITDTEYSTSYHYDVAWKHVQTRKQAVAYGRKAAQAGYKGVTIRPTQDVIFDTYSSNLVFMGVAETVLSAPYGKVRNAVVVEK